jgi:hypothetical protein
MTTERKARSSRKSVVKVKEAYQPTLGEIAAVNSHFKRRRSSAPRLKVIDKSGITGVVPDHPSQQIGETLLMEALGTTDRDFLAGFMDELLNLDTNGCKIEERPLNYRLALVKGIAPRDQLEAMLAEQMAAIHLATMTSARRLAHANDALQRESAEGALAKLARTFTLQMEALGRYRGKGQQKVTVEHVHVYPGGQAIVGIVEHQGGGGGAEKLKEQPHALGYAPSTPMPRADTTREPVPVARDEKRSVSDARRSISGGAEG